MMTVVRLHLDVFRYFFALFARVDLDFSSAGLIVLMRTLMIPVSGVNRLVMQMIWIH